MVSPTMEMMMLTKDAVRFAIETASELSFAYENVNQHRVIESIKNINALKSK